jgi:hypothetical protein
MVLTLHHQDCPNKPRQTLTAEDQLCHMLTFGGCEMVRNDDIMNDKDGTSFCRKKEYMSAV